MGTCLRCSHGPLLPVCVHSQRSTYTTRWATYASWICYYLLLVPRSVICLDGMLFKSHMASGRISYRLDSAPRFRLPASMRRICCAGEPACAGFGGWRATRNAPRQTPPTFPAASAVKEERGREEEARTWESDVVSLAKDAAVVLPENWLQP
ncbi:hypothetical protein F5Y18DRAFT_368744 [Xylariaceae sp. FL1019]|nr:hypothetical protein F5Y18DRAFT_368744 [Xylariaceae sp. FL1019]